MINATDLKIFSNTNILLKVDHFKGFSNQSNVDKLVINSMSGCNRKYCKLNNKDYKFNNNLVFSLSEYFLIDGIKIFDNNGQATKHYITVACQL